MRDARRDRAQRLRHQLRKLRTVRLAGELVVNVRCVRAFGGVAVRYAHVARASTSLLENWGDERPHITAMDVPKVTRSSFRVCVET